MTRLAGMWGWLCGIECSKTTDRKGIWNMKQQKGRIAVYSRKSRFTGKGESVGTQIELCKAYIRTVFGETWAAQCVVFEDEGFSGGNLNRPGFRTMMEGIRAHQFCAVVVYRLDRISRNISDFTTLIEELNRLGVSFVSIREQFDTATPMGRAMMFIISVFSQLERETIAERIRDNLQELAKTGRWLGGNTPTGFTSASCNTTAVDGKRRTVCRLELIPEEAELVRTIFDLYTETDSLTATEAELIRQRRKSKTGRNFSRFSIRAILQNPVYLTADEAAWCYFTERGAELCVPQAAFDGNHGIMAYHRTLQEKGKTTVYLPVQDWIIAVGEHPGLIASRQWIQIQQSLERNRSDPIRKPRRNEAILTGVLYCVCGARMYPKLSSGKTGNVRYTYVCSMKVRSKQQRCNVRNADGTALDTVVLEQIKQLDSDAEQLETLLEQDRRWYLDAQKRDAAQQMELRAEQKQNETKITGLVDSLALLPQSAAKLHAAARIEQLHADNQEITRRIQNLKTDGTWIKSVKFGQIREQLATFASMDLTLEERRTAIRNLVQQVVWDGENAHLILYGTDDANPIKRASHWGKP